MLQEKLASIHRAEAQANQIIQEAKAKAQDIRGQAQTEAGKAVKRIEANTERRIAKLGDELLAKAGAERQQLLAGAESQSEAVRSQAKARLDQAVSLIVSRATGGLVS